jgi:hypothetical protein
MGQVLKKVLLTDAIFSPTSSKKRRDFKQSRPWTEGLEGREDENAPLWRKTDKSLG